MKRLLALPALCVALLPSLARSLSASALEPDARKKLREFFSPVAAVNMPIFDQPTRTDENLLHFALRRRVLRPLPGPKRINGGNDIVISSKGIDNITYSVFGRARLGLS